MHGGLQVFDPIGSKVDLVQLEASIRRFWEQERVFEASVENRRGAPRFIFYEGPPTANGLPGTHHILARAFKDLVARYRTMGGYLVERKAGWDTHGLPVELEVERELQLNSKAEIEALGIERFNRHCRESVSRYVNQWEEFTARIGYWIDLGDAYRPYDSSYIQSIWWALKQMWEQQLVYRGFKVLPYCPRCATALSSHELALGYRDGVQDPSIFVKFALVDEPGTSLLAWTTTPWTLPGNVALAVDPNADYVTIENGGQRLILAEARLEVLEGESRVVARHKGSDLVGRDYLPLYPYLPPTQRAFYVVAADFVSLEEGTGVVHTAAAYGHDDLELCQAKGLPVRHTVDLSGRFVAEVEAFAGLFVKEADPRIIDDLRQRGLLYRSGTVSHTYPFCWRCETPLLYYAMESWFVRTSERKDQLMVQNQLTNWVPQHVREGRMGDWLANNVDWAISRSRYWGTPLPIWVCQSCAGQRCVGSAEELGLTLASDLHRPYIDEVELDCDCGGRMRRVTEVMDVWFDSGAMPFAQWGHPYDQQQRFEQRFPADFICEAMDQTRGWFYSLLAESTLIFGRNSYRNVICLGLVLDDSGRKMSKSLGNVIAPADLLDSVGADATRWFFYTGTSAGENYRVSTKVVQEVVRRFLLPLWNVYSFFVTYANIDGYEPGAQGEVEERPVLDRWLLSRLDSLVGEVAVGLDAYDLIGPARAIEGFVTELSNWYVRRSRRRFWKSASDADKLSAYQTLYQTLVILTRLLAPFVPFVSEAMFRNLAAGRQGLPNSVHLCDYPTSSAMVDARLEDQMAMARRVVELGLAARDAARIKVRQPLAGAAVACDPMPEEIAAIVREELNVKRLDFAPAGSLSVSLDLQITDALRHEGLARELVRRVQDLRKSSGLNIDDRIRLSVACSGELKAALEGFGEYICGETLSLALESVPLENGFRREVSIDGESAAISLARI